MGYIKTTPAAVGAVPTFARPVIRPGAVPPLARPLPRAGIGVRPTLAPRAPVYPPGLRINRPGPAQPTVVPVVSATGRPMRVVQGKPPKGERGVTISATPMKITVDARGKATVLRAPWAIGPGGILMAQAKLDKYVHAHPGVPVTMDVQGQIHVSKGGIVGALLKGTAKKGKPSVKKPVWVNKASKCPKGYFIKKTVLVPGASGLGGTMKFWCWPNPVTKPKRVIKGVRAARPTRVVQARPVTHRGGARIASRIGGPAANIRGPVVPVPANIPPMTVVDTPMGSATVIATSAGNVAVPGAVPVGPDVPVGSTVSTDAGPATVIDTPAGNVAVPESMAPPEDEWASDAAIDELLGDTKEAVADDVKPGEPVPPEVAPGAAITADGPAALPTAADASEITKDEKKGGVGKLAVYGGGAWLLLKFFL